jgi:thioredoxin reductase
MITIIGSGRVGTAAAVIMGVDEGRHKNYVD